MLPSSLWTWKPKLSLILLRLTFSTISGESQMGLWMPMDNTVSGNCIEELMWPNLNIQLRSWCGSNLVHVERLTAFGIFHQSICSVHSSKCVLWNAIMMHFTTPIMSWDTAFVRSVNGACQLGGGRSAWTLALLSPTTTSTSRCNWAVPKLH